jgi:precorrin-6B methylase 2
MSASYFARQPLLTLCLSVLTAAVFAQAQPAAEEFHPQIGQHGKDVIWVPTPQALVDRMLDLAKVTPGDYLIDLGSGDGRTVITAAKRGARTLGVEFNPDMVELSRRNAAKEGVGDKARFVQGDIFETDFSQATVITLFLLPELNIRLRPKILDMKPGTRVVSNSFTMEEWNADQTVTANNACATYCTAFLWIVPGKVEGTWRIGLGELTLKQEFQMISGTLRSGGNATRITNGRLHGDRISFGAGADQYTGRVTGNAMGGTVKSGSTTKKWSATRAGTLAKK